MSNTPLYIIAVILILVLLFIVKKHGKSWLNSIKKLIILLVVIVILAIAIAFIIEQYGFSGLKKPQLIATIRFKQIEPQHYRAQLTYPNGTITNYTLEGDSFQLDARVMINTNLLCTLNCQPDFTLERLAGFYNDHTKAAEKNSFLLARNATANLLARNQNGDKSIFGSAVFMPMQNQAEYQIFISRAGLLAKPVNQQAEQAVISWS